MGLRGPQPKPTVLKRSAGNPGRRQLNENEPLPPPGEVLPPSFLDGRALEYWHENAPIAIAMRTLTRADRMTFARWCDKCARYEMLRDFMKTKTSTTYPVKGENGKVRCFLEYPQAAELRRLDEQLTRAEREFGFTPASRSRIRVEPVSPSTPSNAFAASTKSGNYNIQAFLAAGGPDRSKGAS